MEIPTQEGPENKRGQKPKIEDFEAFCEKFKAREHGETESGNPMLLETYGAELETVRKTDPRHVWTLLDGDDGELYVCAGFHLVNRVNYIISEMPWLTGDETFKY